MVRDTRERILKSIFVCFIGFATMASSAARAESLERAPLQKVFARPLIVGASVSSGALTPGPGTRATEMVMGTDTSVNIARNGGLASDFTGISPAYLAGYTLVIGLDFLFWDTTHDDISASRAALTNLIRAAHRARIPLVLGDIPALIGFQKESSRLAINREIRALCRPSRHCILLPIEKLHRAAATKGIVIGGQLYHYSDLSSDGIHINRVASEYMAKLLIGAVARGR